MSKYVKANLINLFYKTEDGYKFFAYGQSHSLSVSSSTTEVSSKDHGNHPDSEVTQTSFTLSGEFYFTKENANTALAMANAATPITFCFAQVAETSAADGLQPVTNYGSQSTWSIGSDFKEYGNAIITSFSIQSQTGEVATCSIEATGQGALSATEPTGTNAHAWGGTTTINASTGD